MKTDQRYQSLLSGMMTDPEMLAALTAVSLAYEEYYARKVLDAARSGSPKCPEFVHYADAWRGFVPALMEEAGLKK